MPGDFNLSRPLETQYPWIQSAKIYDGTNRQVIVNHAEGTNLHITLQGTVTLTATVTFKLSVTGDEDGHQLMFFHNQSRINDFSGTIIVDSRSNRFFNVTVNGASGKINGLVKYSTTMESDDIYSFSTYVHDLQVSRMVGRVSLCLSLSQATVFQAANRSMIVPLPAVVEAGPRMICLRADEDREDFSICHIVHYHEIPLEVCLCLSLSLCNCLSSRSISFKIPGTNRSVIVLAATRSSGSQP